MENILEKVPNVHWIGIEFSEKEYSNGSCQPMRFCESIMEAVYRSEPFILNKENVNCPGAQYAFGWSDNLQWLQEKFFNTHQIDKITSEAILSKIKRAKRKINSIIIKSENPDIYIGFIQPGDALRIIQHYTFKSQDGLENKIVPLLAICLNTALKAFNDNKVYISFGCEDSRKYSAIGSDRLAIAIPNYGKYNKVSKEINGASHADLRVSL